MRETELKYAVHASFVVPALEGVEGIVSAERLTPQELFATYYDAKDLRLARSGVTLRYRLGDEDGPVWTLKLPTTEGPATREELTFSGEEDSIPTEAVDLVTAFLRSGSLEPIATLHTTRVRWKLTGKDGEPLATLCDDEVSLLEGDDLRTRFREIELESDGMSLKRMTRLGETLLAAGAMPAEPIPKAVRALGPRATAPPDVALIDDPSPNAPAGVAVQAALTRSLQRLISNDPLARLGDPEGVHQMRVAARRVRSDLSTFGSLVDNDWATNLRKELEWVGNKLGEVRDLDVLQARLSESAADLEDELKPLFHILAAREADARTRMSEALGSARYRSLLDRLLEGATGPPLTAKADKPSGKVLPELVAPVWKELAKRSKGLSDDAAPEKWHKVRIQAKRARYATEAVAPALGADSGTARRFARRVAAVQDNLGEHQDAIVAAEEIRGIAEDHQGAPAFGIATGRLIERELGAADLARKQWPEVWARLDRKKNTHWLRG